MKFIILILMTLLLTNFSIGQVRPELEWIPYRVGDKWGYSNKDKEIVIEPKYEKADRFYSNKAAIKLNGKFGFIDKEGNEITKIKYDSVGRFEGKCAFVYKKKRVQLIDEEGKRMKRCGMLYSVNRACVRNIMFDMEEQTYKENGKYGMITLGKYDKEERKIVKDSFPAEYDEIEKFGDGYIKVKKGKLYGLWDFMSRTNDLLVELKYEEIELSKNRMGVGLIRVKKNGLYGFITNLGEEKIEAKYLSANFFEIGLSLVEYEKGKWGYIDKEGIEYFE